MEDYLRLGLLSIAAFIVFFIVFESWLRRRRLKVAELSALNFAGSANIDSFAPLQKEFNLTEVEEDFELEITEPEIVAIVEPAPEPEAAARAAPATILTLSVFAKGKGRFVSYDLLQAISATGLQFGEMNIFHYYLATDKGRLTLFSLASATRPGDFDLDQIGNFSCVGLTLFINLATVPDAESAFAKMLLTAQQLADDLDGELFAKPGVKWSQETLREYRRQLMRS